MDNSNGIGPEWFPAKLRKAITEPMSRYFNEAAWETHDEGYKEGGSAYRRLVCDLKFYAAMVKDAEDLRGFKRILARWISWFFYWCCRLFGWTAFNYH